MYILDWFAFSNETYLLFSGFTTTERRDDCTSNLLLVINLYVGLTLRRSRESESLGLGLNPI